MMTVGARRPHFAQQGDIRMLADPSDPALASADSRSVRLRLRTLRPGLGRRPDVGGGVIPRDPTNDRSETRPARSEGSGCHSASITPFAIRTGNTRIARVAGPVFTTPVLTQSEPRARCIPFRLAPGSPRSTRTIHPCIDFRRRMRAGRCGRSPARPECCRLPAFRRRAVHQIGQP